MALLETGAAISYPLAKDRQAWLHVAAGSVMFDGLALAAGDGAGISGEKAVELVAAADSEILLFDLKQ